MASLGPHPPGLDALVLAAGVPHVRDDLLPVLRFPPLGLDRLRQVFAVLWGPARPLRGFRARSSCLTAGFALPSCGSARGAIDRVKILGLRRSSREAACQLSRLVVGGFSIVRLGRRPHPRQELGCTADVDSISVSVSVSRPAPNCRKSIEGTGGTASKASQL